jgi:hypothetical protein
MVAGRLLFQMVWRQAVWATDLKMGPRTSNQNFKSPRASSPRVNAKNLLLPLLSERALE